MTDSEVVDLFVRAKNCDKKAQEQLHQNYDSLFKYYADKYSKRYPTLTEFDDLLQEAHMGLLKAIRNFNPDKAKNGQMSITTYVYFYMLDQLQSACDYRDTDLTRSIHGSGETDYADSIPDQLDIEDEIIASETQNIELETIRLYLESLLARYSVEDRIIIRMRLGVTTGVPRTLSEISSVLNMSIESVRKRERAILKELISHKVNFRQV